MIPRITFTHHSFPHSLFPSTSRRLELPSSSSNALLKYAKRFFKSYQRSCWKKKHYNVRKSHLATLPLCLSLKIAALPSHPLGLRYSFIVIRESGYCYILLHYYSCRNMSTFHETYFTYFFFPANYLTELLIPPRSPKLPRILPVCSITAKRSNIFQHHQTSPRHQTPVAPTRLSRQKSPLTHKHSLIYAIFVIFSSSFQSVSHHLLHPSPNSRPLSKYLPLSFLKNHSYIMHYDNFTPFPSLSHYQEFYWTEFKATIFAIPYKQSVYHLFYL